MAFLSKLVVNLTANTATFQSDLGRAAHMADKTMRQISKSIDMAGTAIKAFAAGAVVNKMHDMASAAIKAAADLDDFAERTGSSVEALSALKNVADVSGQSFEGVVGAIDKFAKGLAGLEDETKGAGQALAVLGISATDSNGNLKDAADIVKEVAFSLDKYQDGLGKSQLVQSLFGKGAAALIPYLKDVATSGDLVTTTTTEQAAAAEDYEKQVKRLGLSFDAFVRTMVLDALPTMSKFRDILDEVGREASSLELGKIFSTMFVETLKTIVVLGANIAFVFKGIGTEIGGIAAQMSMLATGNFKGFSAIGQAMKEDAAKARKDIDAFSERVMNIGSDSASRSSSRNAMYSDAGYGAGPDKPALGPMASGGKSGGGKGAGRASTAMSDLAKETSNANKLIKELQTSLDQVGMDDFAKETMSVNARIDEFTHLSAAARDSLKAQSLAIRTNTMEMEGEVEMEKEWLKQRAELAKERVAFVDGLILEGEETNKLGTEVERLTQMFLAGEISKERFDAALKGTDYSKQLGEPAKKAAEEVSGFWQEAAKNIQGSMGDFLVDAMEGNWKSIGAGFTKMLNRMVAEAIAAQIMEKMVGKGFAGGEKGSSVGGWIGMAMSAWGGGKAGGGPVSAGMGYMVGEKGAEFFSPSVSGNITPNSGMGGQKIVNNFTIAQPASRETQSQVAAAAQTGMMRAARRNN